MLHPDYRSHRNRSAVIQFLNCTQCIYWFLNQKQGLGQLYVYNIDQVDTHNETYFIYLVAVPESTDFSSTSLSFCMHT